MSIVKKKNRVAQLNMFDNCWIREDSLLQNFSEPLRDQQNYSEFPRRDME